MPTAALVGAAVQFAGDLVGGDLRDQQLTPRRAERFSDGERRRKRHAGRMSTRQPHVVVIGGVTENAVNEGRLRRGGAELRAPNRALRRAASALDKLEGDLADLLRAAGKRHADDIENLPLSALDDLARNGVIFQLTDKAGDIFGSAFNRLLLFTRKVDYRVVGSNIEQRTEKDHSRKDAKYAKLAQMDLNMGSESFLIYSR